MSTPRIPLLVLGLALAACAAPVAEDTSTRQEPPAPTQTAAERGRYLVNAMACDDCHTPFELGPAGPEPDMTRRLSGHPAEVILPPAPAPEDPYWIWFGAVTNTAFAGPWGVSYALNLTPAPSGLGAWTEDTFVQALRTGRHWGAARPILPPMPWQAIGQLNDEDLRAIFAFLQTLPPIDNQVPDALPAEPMAAGEPAG